MTHLVSPTPGPGLLIPAQTLIDGPALLARILADLPTDPDPRASRTIAVRHLTAAKIRANRAVGIGTALAHQVHGGIGFTEEYPLHPLTRRLWAWRSEFGNDAFWGKRLGANITERGAAHFWSDLTALTD